MSNEGKLVKVHYKGTLDDGEVFDSSYDHNEPIEFTCMAGQMIKGFDEAVRDMEVGEKKTISTSSPKKPMASGTKSSIQTIPLDRIPNSADLPDSGTIYFQGPDGMPIPAEVVGKKDGNVTFDMNHPMAGKPLNFELELVEVADPE